MRPLWPADPRRCVPFHIATEESGGQGLIGGLPPRGVVPRYEGLRYFLTVPLFEAPQTMASVFLADLGTVLLELSGQLHPLGAVDVVLHPPAERGTNEALRSDLSPRLLVLGPEESDDYIDEEGTIGPRGDHKLGGRPGLAYQPQQLEDDVEQLLAAGFSHVLQTAFFPGGDDASISGNWPLGERELHLFAKPPYSTDLWRWCRER
jgi:hypothetical protein